LHRSIKNEERYDNFMTKSQVLDALSRKDEATTARNRALTMANAIQLHGYARQLQINGKQAKRLPFTATMPRKNPDQWIVHAGLARMYSAQGDFTTRPRNERCRTARRRAEAAVAGVSCGGWKRGRY